MSLRTIQSLDAWVELQVSGILRCYDQFVEKYNCVSYQWLAKKMEKRIPVRRPESAFPVWTWYQWEE